MAELIREYGKAAAGVLTALAMAALLGYACSKMTGYMAFFADVLMGGGR